MKSKREMIVIEGIDGAGKTTTSEYLAEEHDFYRMSQPEDSWVGEAARKALNEDVEPACDLFLHLAAHANQQAKLRSRLKNSNVVMDRYYHSRVAYQAVQTHFSAIEIEEMHLDWSVEPSKTILFDIPARDALERKLGAKDKFENADFLSEVRSVYLDTFAHRDDVVVVDARKSKGEVLAEVKSELSIGQ